MCDLGAVYVGGACVYDMMLSVAPLGGASSVRVGDCSVLNGLGATADSELWMVAERQPRDVGGDGDAPAYDGAPVAVAPHSTLSCLGRTHARTHAHYIACLLLLRSQAGRLCPPPVCVHTRVPAARMTHQPFPEIPELMRDQQRCCRAVPGPAVSA